MWTTFSVKKTQPSHAQKSLSCLWESGSLRNLIKIRSLDTLTIATEYTAWI